MQRLEVSGAVRPQYVSIRNLKANSSGKLDKEGSNQTLKLHRTAYSPSWCRRDRQIVTAKPLFFPPAK